MKEDWLKKTWQTKNHTAGKSDLKPNQLNEMIGRKSNSHMATLVRRLNKDLVIKILLSILSLPFAIWKSGSTLDIILYMTLGIIAFSTFFLQLKIKRNLPAQIPFQSNVTEFVKRQLHFLSRKTPYINTLLSVTPVLVLLGYFLIYFNSEYGSFNFYKNVHYFMISGFSISTFSFSFLLLQGKHKLLFSQIQACLQEWDPSLAETVKKREIFLQRVVFFINGIILIFFLVGLIIFLF